MSPSTSRNAHGVVVSAASDLSGPGALSNVIRFIFFTAAGVKTADELEGDQKGHRAIALPIWELFLLLTDQHPCMRIVLRK